jgi:ribosome production factor 2
MEKCEFVRRKAKSQRTKRQIERKQSLVNENPKRTLSLHGEKSSDITKEVQRVILFVQSSPHVVKLREGNKTHPFETTESLEFLGFKNDCSLFCFGNHSKKRPHNIIIGRQFNFKAMDMVELGVRDCSQDSSAGISSNLGSKPAMIFLGPEFDFPIFDRLRNILLDFFGGAPVENLNANGLDRAIGVTMRCNTELPSYDIPTGGEIVTFPEGTVIVHLTHVALRSKGGQGSTTLEVVPDSSTVLEFCVRRIRFATPQAFNFACKQAPTSKNEKGVSRDALGELRGQVHVGKQEVDKITKRRFKRVRGGAAEAEGDEGEADNVPRRRKTQGIPDLAADI